MDTETISRSVGGLAALSVPHIHCWTGFKVTLSSRNHKQTHHIPLSARMHRPVRRPPDPRGNGVSIHTNCNGVSPTVRNSNRKESMKHPVSVHSEYLRLVLLNVSVDRHDE